MSPPASGRYCRSCGVRLSADNRDRACRPCLVADRRAGDHAPLAADGYWTNDEMTDALRSRHMGRVIAIYRHRPPHGVPLSQEVVGRWVGITQAQLSRLENGPPIKNLDKLTLWARALRIPAHLLWFSMPDTDAWPCIPPAGSLRDIGDNGAPSPLLPSGALTGISLPSDVEAGGRLRLPDGTAIPATTSGAGAALADELLATMAHYVTTDNLVGPAPLVNVVPRHVAYIEELLIQHADAPERLLYVGARFAEFAGWLYQDTGDARAALQWSNVALEFARHCGDPQLTSYIWMRKSNIGSDARRPQLAIAFAGAALEDAKALTPHQRAVALRQEAHAHALAGDADASARAIDLAYSFASRPAGSKDDIAQYCTPAYVEMEAAHCLIELGRPDQAIVTLQRGLADWHPAFRRDLGLGLARLAVAHARAEDADNAVAIAEHALAIALDTRSRRTADQLSRLPGLLQAIGADEPARHLRHRLTALR